MKESEDVVFKFCEAIGSIIVVDFDGYLCFVEYAFRVIQNNDLIFLSTVLLSLTPLAIA